MSIKFEMIKPSNPADWCFDKKNLLVLLDDNFKGIVGENVTREQVGEIIKLLAETAPKFKVGDWWEHSSGSHHRIVKVDKKSKTFEIDDYEFPTFYLHNGYEVPDGIERGSYIIRKLDPSEVVLDFGNGIKGRVCIPDGEWGFAVLDDNNDWIAQIDPDALDAQMRELVESLLKAQEKK